MFAAVLTGDMTPLSSELPEVDPALEAVVHRCLERDRDARFASVGELAQALVPFGDARAAAMAASIVNIGVATPMAALESGANARATVPLRKQQASPELPETHIANSMPPQPSENFDKKALTTHRASAGQVAVAAPEEDFDEPRKRGPLPLIGGLVACAVLALVGTTLFSGDSDSSSAAPAAQPAAQSAVQRASDVPVMSIDAGVPDAAVPVAPPDAAPAPALPRSNKPRKQPTPRRDPKPAVDPKADPKPDPKPKPKPKDDPFGTMQ
jgi:serine/threonine-protein kinase